MLHQTFLFLGQLWQLFEVSQILEFLRYLKFLCIVILIFRLIENNPEVAMDSIVHITQHMTPGQRAEVSRILASMET